MARLAPLAGPAAGGFISKPAGNSFCSAPPFTLKGIAVRPLRSIAEALSCPSTGAAANIVSATIIVRITSSHLELWQLDLCGYRGECSEFVDQSEAVGTMQERSRYRI